MKYLSDVRCQGKPLLASLSNWHSGLIPESDYDAVIANLVNDVMVTRSGHLNSGETAVSEGNSACSHIIERWRDAEGVVPMQF